MDTRLSKTGEEYSTDQTQTRPGKFSKTSSNYIEFLPVYVLFDILVRVPAQDIHNSARLVCRKWYKIINTRDFKHAHLHRSTTCGLLAHQHMTFIATGSKADDPIEISRLNYHKVLSSSSGLVLASRDNRCDLYITNPATEQKLDLPPCFSNNISAYGCAIAYVAATMEYKVVRAFVSYPEDYCVAILTVGVDKDWKRRVKTRHLSRQSKTLLLEQYPLTTQGFVHWAPDDGVVTWAGNKSNHGHVLTLNVETEIITQFPLPSLRLTDKCFCTQVVYLPMGSYLSMLTLRSEFSWDFWEMKPETGEWTEMPIIDLEAQFVSSRNYVLKPVGWLKPREVLVLSVGDGMRTPTYFSFSRTPFCFLFTVRTQKLQKIEFDGYVERCLVHINSLVWMDGC